MAIRKEEQTMQKPREKSRHVAMRKKGVRVSKNLQQNSEQEGSP